MNTLALDNIASPFDTIRDAETDTWSARDLAGLMGYKQWKNFQTPLTRAMQSATNQGHEVPRHFARSGKVVTRAQGGGTRQEDYRLTRFAAYLTAMNGDPNMPQVAEAQAYFAIQTRIAETAPAPAQLTGEALMATALIEAARVLESTKAQLTETTQQLAIAAPKAEQYDTFLGADGWLSMADTAHLLNADPRLRDAGTIGRNRLFKILEGFGWISKQAGHWTPKHAQVQLGRLRTTPSTRTRTDGTIEVNAPTIRVTPKGFEAIRKLLIDDLTDGTLTR